MLNIPALQNLSVTFSIAIILSFAVMAIVRWGVIPMVAEEKVKSWEDVFKYLLFNLMLLSGVQSVLGLYLLYKGF